MSDVKKVYTDGSCLGNPGPGGWGVVMVEACGKSQEIYGSHVSTTNNRMEMQAVIEGLKATDQVPHVEIYTDSQYVQKGVTQWLSGWKARGWRTAGGDPVKNQDLWKIIDGLCVNRLVTWIWVRGHAGDQGNERANDLAILAAKKEKGT